MNIRIDSWQGVIAMLVVVFIYATNLVFSRYSVQHGLDPYDLTALRFGVAGSLLLPYFFKLGYRNLGGIGWRKGICLTMLAGSPYMFLLFSGLKFAPASHAAVLNPGVVPAVVSFGLVILGLKSFSIKRLLSFMLIFAGLILVTSASFKLKGDLLLGDLLLFLSGISWGLFTLLCKLWQLKPLQATTIVSVLSLFYIPIYLIFFYQGFAEVSLTHLVSQAVYQGIFNAIVALLLLTYSIGKLGAQPASLFSPFIPVLATIIAIPSLGEVPDLWQWLGVFLVVFGMLAAALIKDLNLNPR